VCAVLVMELWIVVEMETSAFRPELRV